MATLYCEVRNILIRQVGFGVDLAPHAVEFLRWATGHHQPHWLTTYAPPAILTAFSACRSWPDAQHEIEPLIKGIAVAAWSNEKSDAIDLESDFYWIDSNPSSVDLINLTQKSCLDRWVEVNTEVFPDALLATMVVVDTLSN
jgi:hypothetical protein